VATARFARADEARSRPGSGLGLSVVKALVVAAGGELRMCFGGHHERWGKSVSVACEHGPEMTVTILLPTGSPHRDSDREGRASA
jgi:signal transduction histidine kinase